MKSRKPSRYNAQLHALVSRYAARPAQDKYWHASVERKTLQRYIRYTQRNGRHRIHLIMPCGGAKNMIDDMGIFRTGIVVAHYTDSTTRRELPDVMVDTGSEYNWIPRDVLETLNLRIDLGRKELVPAGPVSVAAAA
jgi:hypothetical protein